jgi:acylphosphatase
MSAEQLHAIVRGRVQGVYFRASTREEARRLSLRGWVRNCPDGSVEVLAAGPRDALQDLLAFLRIGPPGAHVADVEVHWVDGRTAPDPFAVRT